ncbi:MAG: hypothetical protein HQK89_17880, partial [Nitrospirae bacterium]|nr:hypothetical protein [Nitrospirota bacterium]
MFSNKKLIAMVQIITLIIAMMLTSDNSYALTSYTVTPSAGANGMISPSTSQTVASGATMQFSVTPNTGYIALVGGTCGGSLVGNTYTTMPVTANCTVSAMFNSTVAGCPQATLSSVLALYIPNLQYTPSAGSSENLLVNMGNAQQIGSDYCFTVTVSQGTSTPVGCPQATLSLVSSTLLELD